VVKNDLATPRQIYEMPCVEKSKDLTILVGCYYNYLPALPSSIEALGEDHAIEIRYVENHQFDTRRIWVLGSVWYKGKPVMVIQNAGREGDDHAKCFVTDVTMYCEMVQHLLVQCAKNTKVELQADEKISIVDIEAEIPNLTEFYSYDLASVKFEYYR